MKFLLLLIIISFTSACTLFSGKSGGQQAVDKVKSNSIDYGLDAGTGMANKRFSSFSKDGIIIEISADSMLNRFQEKPYALNLCIYQLRDPNSFNQLIEEREGLSRLMQCSRFDGSVVHAKRIVIQPGSDIRDVRDRAEGSQYIGAVAGYYTTEKHQATALLKLPDKAESVMKLELGAAEIINMRLQ